MIFHQKKLLKIGTEGVWLPASRTKPIRSDLSPGFALTFACLAHLPEM
jgi:hypothetical protein